MATLIPYQSTELHHRKFNRYNLVLTFVRLSNEQDIHSFNTTNILLIIIRLNLNPPI